MTTLPLGGFRQARSHTAGFATALMVVRYFGAEVTAMDLFRRLGASREGARQSAMVRELRAAGLRASLRHDLDFGRICRAIERNKLVVVHLADIAHWAVIYGYGRDPERVYVADPRPDEGCCQPWEDYAPRLGGLGLVCSRPGADSDVRQTPLALLGEPRPAVRKPEPRGRLRCEVSGGNATDTSDEREQLPLPFA